MKLTLFGLLALIVICFLFSMSQWGDVRPVASYPELAASLNAPELAKTLHFEAGEGGVLFCYIDSPWRHWSLRERQRFSLTVSRDWARLTGNPQALVLFGNGHGAVFAYAVAHSLADGQPVYEPIDE
jgi:hypothetical protein